MTKIISAENAPEMTIKAWVVSIILTVILTASSMYLGLKAGITISASIPASVISLAILSFFKKSNILESNIVQTTASGGMSLASGAIFCLPALLLLGVWKDFNYLETFCITLYGGTLGVLFAIPFRKILITNPDLHFPEGTAIAYVLQAKDTHGKSFKEMIFGGLFGAGISLAQTGFKIIAESWDCWFKAGRTLFGFSFGLSPIMLGAGYIVGSQTAFIMMAGLVISWGIGIPLLALKYGIADPNNLLDSALFLWSKKLRYIGVGVMSIGGFYTFLVLIKSVAKNIKLSDFTLNKLLQKQHKQIARVDYDIPIKYVVFGSILLFIPILINFVQITGSNNYGINIFMVIYSLLAGFVFSVVSGYVVGMIGTSASPISALALSAILIIAVILSVLLGGQAMFAHNPELASQAATMTIVVGVFVICAIAISNDIIQDLKTGYMIGATPWKQQIMQIVGVAIAACMIAPVLHLLYHAYGIGDMLPRAGMDPTMSLAAPQAQLMASIANAVFTGKVSWDLISIGAVIAFITIFVDYLLKKKKLGKVSVIALGISIYLPIFITSTLILGGFIEYLAKRKLAKKSLNATDVDHRLQHGFLLSSGLIAGSSLVGIFLAIPFIIYQSTDVLVFCTTSPYVATGLGGISTVFICYWLYKVSVKTR